MDKLGTAAPATLGGRVQGLDLLRALAIVAVMAYHLSSHGVALPALVEHGWMGVDLFFVLSGYLVGWHVLKIYARNETPAWRHFMLGRALRVLPAYFAVLGFYLLVPAWREGGGLQAPWKFITFTLNLFPEWERGAAYSHAWSLCVEGHFYLLFPLLAWRMAGRATAAQVAGLAIGVVAGGMLLRVALWRYQVVPFLDAGDGGAAMRNFVTAIYNPTYARLDGLLMGVMLAAVRAFRPAWWMGLMRHPWLLIAGGAGIVAGSMTIQPMSAIGATFLFPLVALGCACLLAGAASPRAWPGRRPVPGARLLATLAFSLYLTHKQVYAWLDAAVPGLARQAPAIAGLGYALATIAVAALLYLAIERPGLRLRDRWLGRGAPPAAGTRVTSGAPDAGCLPLAPARRATASDEAP